MPRTSLTVQTITRSGLEATYTAADAANGMDFANTGTEYAHIKNDGGVGITVTIPTSATIDGLAVADRTLAIAAGEHFFIGPFINGYYGNSASTVYLDFDTAASVTVAILTI